MPQTPDIHVFVCINQREPGERECCADKGSVELHAKLKQLVKDRGLKGIRINKAGCLDFCEKGVCMVVYPEKTWYGNLTEDDLERFVQEHLVGGNPLTERVF
jgi:(2Fe-2S) ferredoxin